MKEEVRVVWTCLECDVPCVLIKSDKYWKPECPFGMAACLFKATRRE
jgi:hypothetical protein